MLLHLAAISKNERAMRQLFQVGWTDFKCPARGDERPVSFLITNLASLVTVLGVGAAPRKPVGAYSSMHLCVRLKTP